MPVWRLRAVLNIAVALFVLCLGWLWAGSSGAALGLLWWRTPDFATPWRYNAIAVRPLLTGATPSWLCPLLIVRPRPAEPLDQGKLTPAGLEMVCQDEVGAAEFARVRREWLGRAD